MERHKMSSKTRIQNYLRENKISELFEEMMGKLIRDLPASPLYYLANFLNDKEKKVKQIVRNATSPKKEKLEMSENARLWATAPSQIRKQSASAEVASLSHHDNRKYEKPWLSHSKKSPSMSKSASKLSHAAPISKSTEMERSGDVDKDHDHDEVDLCLIYATPKVFGDFQVKDRSATEEMASELSLTDVHDKSQDADNGIAHTHKKLSAKDAKRERLEDLKRLANENKSRSPCTQSPINIDDVDDEALEVLENADELMNEGVKNPPKSGVIIGRSPDKGKEQIELILNMSKFFDELGGMEGVTQNQLSQSSPHSPIDDDFESASQVTGPRRPVWDAPDTEVESGASQLNGGQVSKIGIDSFIQKKENSEETGEGSKANSLVPSQKSPSPRPHTALPKSSISVTGSQGPESLKKSGKSPCSRPTTPKNSRPATPRGSQVGSGRASRRMSQASNLSAKQDETAKSVNDSKAKE